MSRAWDELLEAEELEQVEFDQFLLPSMTDTEHLREWLQILRQARRALRRLHHMHGDEGGDATSAQDSRRATRAARRSRAVSLRQV